MTPSRFDSVLWVFSRAAAGTQRRLQAKSLRHLLRPVGVEVPASRVKRAEKFWNRPTGAEAILRVRAAALSDNDRLRVTSPGELETAFAELGKMDNGRESQIGS